LPGTAKSMTREFFTARWKRIVSKDFNTRFDGKYFFLMVNV
jgi:hypothetical protein